MRGKRIAMLAAAALLGATACSESGSVSGDGAPTPAGVSNQSPTADLSSSDSSPTADEDSVAATDPCTLVTKAEAEKLVGTAVDDAIEAGQGTDSPSCTYTGPTSGPTAQVEVHTGPGAKKYYDLERDGLSHAMLAAPGIGDEAWTDEDDLSIFVRRGDAWFVIHIVVLDDPDKFIPRLRDAAKAAVVRA